MTRSRRAALVGTGLLALVASMGAAGVTASAAPVRAPAFTKTEAGITRDHLVNGADQVVDTRNFTVNVSNTTGLRDRQTIDVTWSGGHPTGGIFADPNSGAAAQEEYPVVLLQCRGVDSTKVPAAQQMSPKTCWTSTPLERYQASDFIFPSYRVDRYSAPADRTIAPGQPTPVPAACNSFVTGGASYWLPFVAANGHVYSGGGGDGCAGIPPEATVIEGAVPSNQTYGVSDLAGNGSAKFVVQTADTNASLGCSDTVPCTVEVVPILGISCDTAAQGLPAVDQPATYQVEAQAFALCSQTGAFAPGSLNSGGVNQEDLAVAGALWWSGSNWQHRITVPLTFAPSANVCSVISNSAPLYVYGSESMIQASLQWAPSFCLNPHLFKFQHVQTGEPQAKNLLDTGSVEAAFQAGPPTPSFSRPVVQAPVALTGFVIATNIDDVTGHDLPNVKLTPRLLAKLISESYPSNPSVRNEYPPDLDGTPTLSNNPYSMARDPEFLALNPTAVQFPLATEPAATLMSLSGDSDVIAALTAYIWADPDARAFLTGTPDPWGMRVNPNYEAAINNGTLTLPTNYWPLLDVFQPRDLYTPSINDCLAVSPVPWLPLVASPVSAMAAITLDMQYNIANSQINCVNPTQQNQKLAALGRQAPGTRFMLGLTSLADAQRYQLDTAELLTHTDPSAPTMFTDTTGRTFVAPTNASLKAAAALLKPDKTTNTWPVPYDTMRTAAAGAAAYPGTLLISVDVPVSGLPKADASRYATFMRFAAGPGQVPGVGNGQLPPGFLPLTAANGLGALAAFTDRAATSVAAQTADLPYVTGGSSGPAHSSTPPTSTGPVTAPAPAASTPAPAGSRPPATSAAPSASGSPVAASPVSLGTTSNIGAGSLGLALPAVALLAVLCALAVSLTGRVGRRRGKP